MDSKGFEIDHNLAQCSMDYPDGGIVFYKGGTRGLTLVLPRRGKKFSYVPKSGVRAISLLPSSLYYAVSYKAKHCLLKRKYANDIAAPFGSIFSYISQDAQSLCVQGLVFVF